MRDEMSCSIIIHPKPRGNWRPQVEIELAIKTTVAIRQFIGLRIAGMHPSGHSNPFSLDEGLPVIWVGDLKVEGAELPVLWATEMRGDSEFRTEGRDQTVKCSEVILGPPPLSWLDVGGLRTTCWREVFFLPWRPGDKPDYSDFAERFREIPATIEAQLGRSSGGHQHPPWLSPTSESPAIAGSATAAAIETAMIHNARASHPLLRRLHIL